ncbi:hypothetical protein B9J78_05825 [bacterium Unc6]|nr:hypothetical protein [bacterium Unc6]
MQLELGLGLQGGPLPLLSIPGSPSPPGPVIADLRPILRWGSLDPSVTAYAVAISREPYGPANVIYSSGWISGRPRVHIR